MSTLKLIFSAGIMIFAAGLNLVAAQEAATGKMEIYDTAFPIIIHGKEVNQVNMKLPDGGIPPLPGVHNFQLFRATRDLPDQADGEGWTYAHHQDLAAWQGSAAFERDQQAPMEGWS